jgi:tRNA A-37 threonylcarbamoyl transferase component Bud32
MAPASEREHRQYHVLNFFYDTEDSCALTVLIDKTRFHIIADASKLRKGSIGQQYNRLLEAVKSAGVEGDSAESEDSGMDVSHDQKVEGNVVGSDNAERKLHEWMLSPLHREIEELSFKNEGYCSVSLKSWYNRPTYFYDLEVRRNKLSAIELDPTTELQERISDLVPEVSIPKYIQNIDVPRFSATDLTVINCSDDPPPYHPSRVRSKAGKVYFLKLVDRDQPQPTKREISHLHRIAEAGLHEKIRCPALEGLVMFDNDDTKIMGFLQTDIPQPLPLTLKIDTDIPQELRERWAHESEKMKEVLHEHGIIWGDAKADNFMLDENDQLWIIDFGGSYTEGWVDPEIKETMEGDDMGVEKIANALHDPVKNVWDPDTDKSFGGSSTSKDEDGSKKRKGREEEEDDEEYGSRKRQTKGDPCEKTHCYCDRPSSGRMIGCDGEECERGWFHFECVGFSKAPDAGEKWFCKDCLSAN